MKKMLYLTLACSISCMDQEPKRQKIDQTESSIYAIQLQPPSLRESNIINIVETVRDNKIPITWLATLIPELKEVIELLIATKFNGKNIINVLEECIREAFVPEISDLQKQNKLRLIQELLTYLPSSMNRAFKIVCIKAYLLRINQMVALHNIIHNNAPFDEKAFIKRHARLKLYSLIIEIMVGKNFELMSPVLDMKFHITQEDIASMIQRHITSAEIETYFLTIPRGILFASSIINNAALVKLLFIYDPSAITKEQCVTALRSVNDFLKICFANIHTMFENTLLSRKAVRSLLTFLVDFAQNGVAIAENLASMIDEKAFIDEIKLNKEDYYTFLAELTKILHEPAPHTSIAEIPSLFQFVR